MFKIVIADDDEILLKGLSENFNWKELGISVAAAVEDGQKALTAVKKYNPEILLTDVRMPHMNGIELISVVKKYNSEISTIIISAHDEFSYVHKAIKQGAKDYLLKPVNLENLKTLMKKIVKEKMTQIEFEQEKCFSRQLNMYSTAINRKLNNESELEKYEDILPLKRFRAFQVTIVRIKDDYRSKLNQFSEKYRDKGIYLLRLHGRDIIVSVSETKRDLSEILNKFKEETALLESFFENGNIVKNILQLQESYAQALRVEECFFIHSDERDLYIDDFKSPALENNTYYEQLAYNIAQSVLLGNKATLRENIRNYELQIMKCGSNARVVFTYSLSMSLSEIEKGAKKLDINVDSIIDNSTDLLNKCFLSETLSESVEIFEKNLLLIAEHINRKNDKSTTQQIMNSIRYIEENYKNSELRITNVCETVGLSKSYFSIMFKDIIGESFTDYLTKFRMEKAKELLSNTNFRSYEIGYMIGYTNPTYFSSSFKKFTGVTPSEYSKNSKI